MNYYEQTEKEQVIYSGKIINVKKLDVSLPNGKKSSREIVEHPGAVAIIAKNEKNEIIMVKQFRKAIEEVIWEIPAGKLEKGESPLATAKRELFEESGFKANKWTDLGSFYTSPGFSNEILYLFAAEDLIKGKPQFDEDEFMEIHYLSMEEIARLLDSGQIKDAKTLIGFLKVRLGEI